MSHKETREEIRETIDAIYTELDRSGGEETARYRELNKRVAELEDSLPLIQRMIPTYRN